MLCLNLNVSVSMFHYPTRQLERWNIARHDVKSATQEAIMFHSDTEQEEKWNTTNHNVPVSNQTNLNPPERCEKTFFSRQLGGLAHVTFNATMFHYHISQVEKWNTTGHNDSLAQLSGGHQARPPKCKGKSYGVLR